MCGTCSINETRMMVAVVVGLVEVNVWVSVRLRAILLMERCVDILRITGETTAAVTCDKKSVLK